MPAIRFAVVRTRKWGRKLSDHELQTQQPVIGELECSTCNDAYLRRYVQVFTLTRTRNALRPALIPSLYDAEVISLGSRGGVISGIERYKEPEGVVEFCQAWWFRFEIE